MALLRYRTWFLLRKYYLTFSIICCIIMAEIAPWIGAQGGPLAPEITVKYFNVFVVFFFSGLLARQRDVPVVTNQFELPVLIQAFSFVCIPVFVWVFLFVFEFFFELNPWIHTGMIIMACMPPSVSSAVILMKSLGGNEAAAIFNSLLSIIFGFFLTPLLLFFYMGYTSSVAFKKTFFHLTETMILPLLMGYSMQKLFFLKILHRAPFVIMSQISLLFIIYTSFCDMFVQESLGIDSHQILTTLGLVATIQIIIMFSIFYITTGILRRVRSCTAQDVITVTFCSTLKSLTLGMPLLKTLYGGYSHLSYISLPLLMYHATQMVLGGIILPHGRKWVRTHSEYFSLCP